MPEETDNIGISLNDDEVEMRGVLDQLGGPAAAPEVLEEEPDFSFLDNAADSRPTQASSPAAATQDPAGAEEGDIGAVMAEMGITNEREVPDIIRPWMKHHKFVLVQSVAEVEDIVDRAIAHGRCALDLETQGLDNRITYDSEGLPHTVHKIVGYCISVDGETGYYIPVRHLMQDGGANLNVPVAGVDAAISRLCRAAQPEGTPESIAKDGLSFPIFRTAPRVVIYFWNAQFDQEFLYPVTGIDWWHPDSYEDGMLAYFCKYAADKAIGLKYKAREMLRDKEGNPHEMIELKELFIRGRPIQFDTLSPDEPGVIRYGGSDGICTYLLCEPPRPQDKGENIIQLARTKFKFTYRLEKQVSQVVRVMERNRVKVHRARIRELYEQHRQERDEILLRIREFGATKQWPNLDPNSPKQLSDFLFSDGPNCLNITIPASSDYPNGKPPKNEASGQYKTDAESLGGMISASPHVPAILKWIVEFRGVEKVLGTYLQGLMNNPDANDEMRFSFKQTGAGTGRFSAPANADRVDHGFGGIPVHGIPGESALRKVFVAREGYVYVKSDYAGQELRIAANVSGEPVWIKEFLEGDGDLHTITAMAFYNKPKNEVTKDERKGGKIANFALIYGGGPQAIMRATGCDKVEGARRKQAFDKSVPVFASWIKKQHASVKKDLGVWTAFGRWLAIPDANHPDRAIQAACERYSTNYPIQGAGADIMKISMVVLHKEFHKRGWLRNGGDDSVRILMTVHDELVFEIRHDRVVDAIPVIVSVMESPTHMAKPSWRVPLIVEPLIGMNWGSGYKCERVKKGYKLKATETLIGGYVYGKARVVDLGKDKPEADDGEVEEFRDEKTKKLGIIIPEPPWLRNINPQDPGVEVAESTEPPAAPPPPGSNGHVEVKSETPAPVVQATPAPSAKPGRVVTMKINRLNKNSFEQVRLACFQSLDNASGKLLRLTDAVGTILIDPTLGLRVNPQQLSKVLFSLNLSDGEFVEEA